MAQNWTESLIRNGIPVVAPDGTQPAKILQYRRYAVQVHHFRIAQAVSIKPSGPGLQPVSQRIVQEEDPALWNKLERTASRAVYAAGWQAGVVKLELRGKSAVVVACEELSGSGRLAARPIHLPHKQPVLIGMDPEFVLLRDNGRIALASRYVGRRGLTGSDGIRVRGRVLHPIVELRPQPASDPDLLFRRLKGALVRAARQITDKDLRWAASGMPVRGIALGGHIHISGIALTDEVVRALDQYVALPFLMVEDSASLRRRPKYGCLGDVRRQPHGGFEYRTLPSWLVAPKYTYAAIVLCKLAAEHAGRLTTRSLFDRRLQEAYYAGNKQVLLPVVRQLYEEWQSLPAYVPYSRKLKPFWDQALSGESWSCDRDMRHAWKLFRYQCQT
ncbi:hypothetical protein DUZ99_11390 [Xylanibacillus composti]|uniref:PhiEco32-like amidoligase-type 2 protein n=1 Tax=Xylanibacillus composti TaxID=1572762 RepID=A0A8J4H310_9BACL|nr:hypothetical protein [Xylanibacillus composti]MDT9725575.1 hypothetical protein [Xylanibacillus composti]GIQ67668.1 hypothetical protein XYCOK13_04920 [Xylanibacillus composti]